MPPKCLRSRATLFIISFLWIVKIKLYQRMIMILKSLGNLFSWIVGQWSSDFSSFGDMVWRLEIEGTINEKAGGKELFSISLVDNLSWLNKSCELLMTCFSLERFLQSVTFFHYFYFPLLNFIYFIRLNGCIFFLYSCHKLWTHIACLNCSSTE